MVFLVVSENLIDFTLQICLSCSTTFIFFYLWFWLFLLSVLVSKFFTVFTSSIDFFFFFDVLEYNHNFDTIFCFHFCNYIFTVVLLVLDANYSFFHSKFCTCVQNNILLFVIVVFVRCRFWTNVFKPFFGNHIKVIHHFYTVS